jgi:hypothetical protein
LNSGLCTHKVGALLLKPFCSGYFGAGDLEKLFAWAALNYDLPDLSLPSNWDYRCALLVPSFVSVFLKDKN